MKKSLQLVCLLSAFFLPTICHAGCKIDVSKFVGWSIIHSGTVTGFIDGNGEENDSFEGCEYGRRLIIDYQYQVTCTTYAYHYAYHPDIVILSKGSSKVACIDGDTFDIE
jgi:hypothetical protein